VVEKLREADNALVLLGNIAGRHGASSAVRALAAGIAEKTGAKLGTLSPGANSAGLSLAGVLPGDGLHAGSMLDKALDAVVLLNLEPDADIHSTSDAVAKLAKQNYVVALTPFVSDALLESADLLLPVGTFAETSGTYVNVEGTSQSFGGIASPVGEARPAWKVLRVLGNLVGADGFDYVTSEDVLAEFNAEVGDVTAASYVASGNAAKANGADAPADEIDTPLYSVDGLVRRATALQLTPVARRESGEGGD
jgi:NADH-quinone oxidoreductase subunit G